MVNFRNLVENALNEDFTGVTGQHHVSELEQGTSAADIRRFVNNGNVHKLAQAAAHPNSDKGDLEKALDHGGLDQIVAIHPNTPLTFLKRIMAKSGDTFARMAAAHNNNMTTEHLESAYQNEKDPIVKAEMLRSRHMSESFLKMQEAYELTKQYPSQYKLESLRANINSPYPTVNDAPGRLEKVKNLPYLKHDDGVTAKVPAKSPAKSTKNPALARLTELSNEVAAHGIRSGNSSYGDIHVTHYIDEDNNRVIVHATHRFPVEENPSSQFNANKKHWDGLHYKFDEITSNPDVQKMADASVDKTSFGKIQAKIKSDAKLAITPEEHIHSSSLILTPKE